VPVAQAKKSIYFDSLFIDDSIADLGRDDCLRQFHFDRIGLLPEGDAFVVGEPDPHKIHGNDDPLVASFNCAHGSDIDVRKYIAGTRMHAGVTAQDADRAMYSRKPNVGRNANMPAAIGGRFILCLWRRGCRGLSPSD
jgi:hypothetical protein